MTIKSKREVILNAVCASFEVTLEELRSKAKNRKVFYARCAYSYLAKHQVGDSHYQIASDLNKARETALYQIESMNYLIMMRDQAAELMKEIERELVKIFSIEQTPVNL